LLRIRSFLWLGIVFLLLDITAMIWHAAVDLEQTWIWYACGIVLGAVIIALFALFEKRRNDLLAAVGKLKQWER
jgi:membrane protein YdbS with pleckstrin-like domain